MAVSKEYKDSIIRTLFKQPEKALKLYSAITGKAYASDTAIEMKDLDDVFMYKLRNDLSFVINGKLIVIVEHQSTWNPNMPLRMLQYILLLYEIFYKLGNALYKQSLIKLPTPEFYMLYNGKDPYPAKTELRLSDAFITSDGNKAPSLELVVQVININYGVNDEIMEKSEDLEGYSFMVDCINRRLSEGYTLKHAVKLATEECLTAGKLIDFINEHKEELDSMFSLIYDEEIARQVWREEALEEGREEGRGEGIGIIASVIRELKNETPVNEIAERYKIPLEKVEELKVLLS